jgi:hypothetical protein
MAKIITKAVTRLQKFLAAIAGDAVAPTPITNQEKLLFNIAEEMKAASASDLPDIGSSDKNKYLHTNESTGALEWANGGSGGGVEEIIYYLKLADVVSGNTVTKIYKDSGCTVEFTAADATKTLINKIQNGEAKILFKISGAKGYCNPSFVDMLFSGNNYWHFRSGFLYTNSSGTGTNNVYVRWEYDNS